MIVLAKNEKVLKHLLKMDPTIFMDAQRAGQTFSDDIMDSVLLCAIKQWNTGVSILITQLEIAFCKAPLLQKLQFALKLFSI